MSELSLLMTIADRSRTDELREFFAEQRLPVLYELSCQGTAQDKHLDLLGIARTAKKLLIGLVYEGNQDWLPTLGGILRSGKVGRGIGMLLPIRSMASSTLQYHLGEQKQADAEEDKMEKQPVTHTHELIMVIAEGGSTDQVMDAARTAGASGGTVLHAKGTALRGTEKFFGVSIAEEKELILIAAEREKKKGIMQAILAAAGADTEARAKVFSLPITEVI